MLSRNLSRSSIGLRAALSLTNGIRTFEEAEFARLHPSKAGMRYDARGNVSDCMRILTGISLPQAGKRRTPADREYGNFTTPGAASWTEDPAVQQSEHLPDRGFLLLEGPSGPTPQGFPRERPGRWKNQLFRNHADRHSERRRTPVCVRNLLTSLISMRLSAASRHHGR